MNTSLHPHRVTGTSEAGWGPKPRGKTSPGTSQRGDAQKRPSRHGRGHMPLEPSAESPRLEEQSTNPDPQPLLVPIGKNPQSELRREPQPHPHAASGEEACSRKATWKSRFRT
uniref:Uncharacterized protein n=1 Tax=Mustela putorius furo TaxID=9669 RepID=M3YYG3_MUSPF